MKALAGVFPANVSERRQFIEILGLADILNPGSRPTFFDGCPPQVKREHPGRGDWSYPVVWWRGRDGVNQAAVDFWFPEL